jgi:hypothetical protein
MLYLYMNVSFYLLFVYIQDQNVPKNDVYVNSIYTYNIYVPHKLSQACYHHKAES